MLPSPAWALALALAAPAAGTVAAAAASTPTHVLFFLIDDLGFADVGYLGNPVGSGVVTPTVDTLAGQGVRLEQYYVNSLCSPTRTSLMSGRYAYNIGMNGEVIVNGHASCMPASVATIADRLSAAGWATSAYGKWDMGMTSWGCTPTCRGFDHFFGFYNAANDYFTHMAGKGLDFRNDTTPVHSLNGDYFTETITADAIRWLGVQMGTQLSGAVQKSTFVYLAHEAVHGPLQVPQRYIDGACAAAIPADRPSRRIMCGMMRSVDDSLANLTAAYQGLGAWGRTVVVMSTDNGGHPGVGGNNAPLRGEKATLYEGGVRGVGWVGGGLAAVQLATATRAMIHVADWYPTIVHGIAGLDVGGAADGTPPLDGVDAWPSITAGAPSARTEMLLQLNNRQKPLQAAIRVGQYKLITGKPAGEAARPPPSWLSGDACSPRDGQPNSKAFPLTITNATSPPGCANGWIPPPESGEPPRPPPDVACPAEEEPWSPFATVPCRFPDTTYTSGEAVLLFDVEADPTEETNLAPTHADIVDQLMRRLGAFTNRSVTQENAPMDPCSDPARFGGVWTPWIGDPDPAKCAAPPAEPCGGDGSEGTANALAFQAGGMCVAKGWCSGPGYSGPPRVAEVTVDGAVVATGLANETRTVAGLHGFTLRFDCSELASGNHTVRLVCKCPAPAAGTHLLGKGETCTAGPPAHAVTCPACGA